MTDTSLRQSKQLVLCTCLYIISSVAKEKVDLLWDGVGISRIKGKIFL